MCSSESDGSGGFTERARKVLSLAQEEAQRLQHDHVGTEHLLLGLVREGEGIAATVLRNLGIELLKVRSAIEFMLGRGDRDRSVFGEEVELTSEARLAINMAMDEARRFNHHYIGTEHLLLGLMRVPESKAVGVLQTMGVSLEQVRTQTIQVLSHAQRPDAQRTTVVRDVEQPFRLNMDAAFETMLRRIGTPEERRTGIMWRGRDRFESDRDRFNTFDEQARKVLSLAQEEAQRFQHNYIGTEHLLLGLVRLENSAASQVLHRLGVNLNRVREQVEFIIGRGDRIILGEIGLTPRAKKVVELAVDEARRLQADHVGTEHLLLGLVREGEGIAAGVLESLGINLERVRTAMVGSIKREQPLIELASAYVRGDKQFEERASGVQDADDLVPEPISTDERGNCFTLRLRRVLAHAREEAHQHQRDEVGTEHLLLALIRERNGIAFHVLRNLGIELERISKATLFLITKENLREPGKSGGFTDDGKRALELTIEEFRQLGQTALGTEALLLGLLKSEGMASGILITRGLTLEKARVETRRLLGM